MAKPGWQHLAAVRDGGTLRLYVDGQKVATSSKFNPADFDISNDEPLRIGFGAHDYFNGCIRDIRVYGGTLDEEHLGKLMAAPRR